VTHIRFTIEVQCQDQEPSRIIPAIDGAIFTYKGKTDKAIRVGNIRAYLVLRGRAVNESESLLDAMDSVSAQVMECYEALFDAESDAWNRAVEETYHGEITELDVLFIESIKLDARHRGKGIGAHVVRETIATFASSCGLVACKPFPLQYSNWKDDAHKTIRQESGFENRRIADFAKAAKFWTNLGFRRLPLSDFYTYAPELIVNPNR
jgi:GNAT superfamily N-acetyltransferase